MKEEIVNFIRFSRPHTIIGTTLSVSVLYILALSINGHGAISIEMLLHALIACFGANIYIVGLNQLTDVEIDKINKPYLPLASGAYSITTGRILVGLSLAIALLFAFTGGPYLTLTVLISLILGTAYSMPPIRLKRFYFWAAFCIIAIRGLVVNIFLYLHFQFQLNGSHTIPIAVILLTMIMFGYSLVIAWFKDIPDMEGDAAHHIKTMSIAIGPEKVIFTGNLLLSLALIFIAVISFIIPTALNAVVMGIAHLAILIALWVHSRQIDPFVHADIRKFYLFIWTLFFLEYISFALAAWMG